MEGHEVKAIRERLGITQAELARRIGVSRRTVESWEWDLRKPGDENADKLRKMEGASK
jgi:DNA-binding transcriptional regulator YiaG